jgi:hypothetical protein
MALDIRKNIQLAFGRDRIMNYGASVLAGILYVVLPSLLKVDGWFGLLVGSGVPFILSILTGIPGFAYAAITNVATHLTYVYGGDLLKKANGGFGVFVLDQGNRVPDNILPASAETTSASTSTTTGTAGIGSFVTFPDGTLVERADDGVSGFLMPESYGVSSNVLAVAGAGGLDFAGYRERD